MGTDKFKAYTLVSIQVSRKSGLIKSTRYKKR
jgi:hypothetical protein